MTTYWNRIRDWWMGQYRNQRGLGRLVWVGAPLLFSCCICSLALAAIAPGGDAEPTAEVADRAAATADLSEPTTAPAAIDEPTAMTRPTARPTNTARPTATDEPTRPPVRAATALAETVVADQLATTAAAPPTATSRPVTATATTAPSATPAPPATATTAPLPTATAVRAATVALPTAIPPTAVPPTSAPLPTATQPPVAAAGDVIIASIRYNGDINPQEPDEYAVITNRGGTAVNLGGWKLNAGEPDQNFGFPSFDLQPGASCRVYTNQVNADSCGGGTFGSGQAIWNNGGDCGILYNAEGAEVSRYCW